MKFEKKDFGQAQNKTVTTNATNQGPWVLSYFLIDGRADVQQDEPVLLPYHAVTPGYFSMLGIPLLKGRNFTEDDTTDAPHVVIVSQGFAKRYWPGKM